MKKKRKRKQSLARKASDDSDEDSNPDSKVWSLFLNGHQVCVFSYKYVSIKNVTKNVTLCLCS